MAAQAQPIVTVEEIDEALWWVVLTAPRDRHYDRIIDALLDQRNRISSGQLGLGDSPQEPSHHHEDRPSAHPTRWRRNT
jgi:hypothetical protein